MLEISSKLKRWNLKEYLESEVVMVLSNGGYIR